MAINVKIATDIFRQKWYRELSADLKTLWVFLMAESNLVGVFEIDASFWNFICRPSKPYNESDPFRHFGNRIQRLDKHPDKGIIIGKLDYQRSFGHNSRQWEWVEKALAEIGLTYDQLSELRKHEEDQMEFDLESPAPAPAKQKPKDERRTIPPNPAWVREYCAQRNKGVDPDQFFDFYESKGWRIGTNQMKDWQAAVRTWEKRPQRQATADKIKVEKSIIRKVY